MVTTRRNTDTLPAALPRVDTHPATGAAASGTAATTPAGTTAPAGTSGADADEGSALGQAVREAATARNGAETGAGRPLVHGSDSSSAGSSSSSAIATAINERDVSTVSGAVRSGGRAAASQPAQQREMNAVIQQALREHEAERGDDLSVLRERLQFRQNIRAQIANERTRVNEALQRLAAMPAGSRLIPPFIPARITGVPEHAQQTVAAPKSFTIDGQTLVLPPEIYQQVGFNKALAALSQVRALAPTTGGPQGCGGGVKNELVSNAFQFLATDAILRRDNGTAYGANADMDYSVFVKELEAYGISSVSNQADGVGGGSVSLEGGRKVSDGVSDGNLDFKDLEWNKASAALANAIGLEVGDLIHNKEVFDEEYTSIASLLSSNDFNPADNDVLVEVLLIAAMIENAGLGIDGAMTKKSELEFYMTQLNRYDREVSRDVSAIENVLLRRNPREGEGEFADLAQPANGAEGATSRDRGNTRPQDTANVGRTRSNPLQAAASMGGVGMAAARTEIGRTPAASGHVAIGGGVNPAVGPRTVATAQAARNATGLTAGLPNHASTPHAAGQTATANRTGAAQAATGAPSFVATQAARLGEALRDEHRLKLKLLDVDLGPQTPGSLARSQADAWNTLGELRSINMDRKLPVLRELATFIVQNRGALALLHTSEPVFTPPPSPGHNGGS